MSARKTALSQTTFSLDGNDHYPDLQVFGLDFGATVQRAQGLGATFEYNQVTKVSGKHNFEILLDNSGPKRTNLDVSVWNPAGSSLLGDLRSGSIKLAIPTQDGSGLATLNTYGNIVGARAISIEAEAFIPSSTSVHALLAKMVSTSVADRALANVLLTIGLPAAFDLPMVMGNVSLNIARDAIQSYKADFHLRGTPGTSQSGSTLWGVAFAGDGILTLAAITGHGTFGGTGVVSSLDIGFADGELTRASGTLELQGTLTYV